MTNLLTSDCSNRELKASDILDELAERYFQKLEADGVEFIEYETREDDGSTMGCVKLEYALTTADERAQYLGFLDQHEFVQSYLKELGITQSDWLMQWARENQGSYA